MDHSLGQEYKNIHQQNIEISTDDKPYIVHKFNGSKHVFHADLSTCTTDYNSFYWLIDGNFVFDQQIVIDGPDHVIKFVAWNELEPEKVIGLIKNMINIL